MKETEQMFSKKSRQHCKRRINKTNFQISEGVGKDEMLLLEITVDTFISLSHCCFAQLLKQTCNCFKGCHLVFMWNWDGEQNVVFLFCPVKVERRAM